ncbi:BTAD domain-containing putative transcriptional regulator [Actinacidiphila alni]|uniref:BTAD domain-containing putative transcriptional regulator n=1 Tax=Actinacidiphila alni TaxID=380248 RepID=UPI0033E6AD52
MRIDVLGAVRAVDDGGDGDGGGPVGLGGPRQREVLARLVVAEGRMVTTQGLVADLWPDPPDGAVGALRTFVAALRRALEPGRPPRTPPRILVTEGSGYALRLPRAAVDVHRFEDALAAARRPPQDVGALEEALRSWRGTAYADLPDSPWVRRERARLEELRLEAVEVRAGALLDGGGTGDGAALVAGLAAHVTEHPWREPAWALLARALYRSGRQADALAAIRRARAMLADRLGLDPGPELARLETDILTRSAALEPSGAQPLPSGGAGFGPRTTTDLARAVALAGGDALVLSRRNRLAAVRAAERTGDVALTARVIGAYDVPAVWARADDPAQAAAVVAAAERALAGLGTGGDPAARARLLATVAVESRSGDLGARERERAARAAREAEALARDLGDPAALAFALDGVFLQSFGRPGLAPRRDAIGAELIALSASAGLPAFAILGQLIRLQSASASGDRAAAQTHAGAVDRLGTEHESRLVPVFTQWFRARLMAERSAEPGGPTPAAVAQAYRAADGTLATAGMPGVRRGLLSLALLGLRLLHDRPAPTGPGLDWGPYLPWAAPLVLLAEDRTDDARAALRRAPEPPRDHLQEAVWSLVAHAAARLGEPAIAARAAESLRMCAAEHAGAASGMLTLGPVARYLEAAENCAAKGN